MYSLVCSCICRYKAAYQHREFLNNKSSRAIESKVTNQPFLQTARGQPTTVSDCRITSKLTSGQHLKRNKAARVYSSIRRSESSSKQLFGAPCTAAFAACPVTVRTLQPSQVYVVWNSRLPEGRELYANLWQQVSTCTYTQLSTFSNSDCQITAFGNFQQLLLFATPCCAAQLQLKERLESVPLVLATYKRCGHIWMLPLQPHSQSSHNLCFPAKSHMKTPAIAVLGMAASQCLSMTAVTSLLLNWLQALAVSQQDRPCTISTQHHYICHTIFECSCMHQACACCNRACVQHGQHVSLPGCKALRLHVQARYGSCWHLQLASSLPSTQLPVDISSVSGFLAW